MTCTQESYFGTATWDNLCVFTKCKIVGVLVLEILIPASEPCHWATESLFSLQQGHCQHLEQALFGSRLLYFYAKFVVRGELLSPSLAVCLQRALDKIKRSQIQKGNGDRC